MAASNGRVYDPTIARFLSPDPMLQSPNNALNYNRYTYCLNNPMLYTDPTGMSWFSDLGDWVGDQWDGMWTGLDNFAKWADKTDWFPSSGGFSTGINLYNYNKVASPTEEYSSGMPSYSEMYLGDMYKISNLGVSLSPTETIDVSSIRLPSVSNMNGMDLLGVNYGFSEINTELKPMQKVNPENFGFELLPTQIVKYSEIYKMCYDDMNRMSLTVLFGDIIVINEKYDYFPKGSIIDKKILIDSKRYFGNPEIAISRTRLTYHNNTAKKIAYNGMKYILDIYTTRDYTKTKISGNINEYTYDNETLNNWLIQNP